MKTKHITALLLGSSLMALSACSESDWFGEAGVSLNGGTFGNATMNNMMIQSGEEGYMLDLARRFEEQVPSTVNFGFNEATLDEAARATLRQQANWIRQFPEVRFRVYGHTDLVGSRAYNQRLGKRRANAVVHYLSTLGISRSRLEAVVSFGETQPLVLTNERERRNRRTVTQVSGFVKSHPRILDGRYAQVINREYVESATAPTGLTTQPSGATAQE